LVALERKFNSLFIWALVIDFYFEVVKSNGLWK